MTHRESAERARCRRSEIVMHAVPSLCKRHRLPRRLHYDLTACPRSSWRVDEVLKALPWRPQSVHTAPLLLPKATALVSSMAKRNADPWRSKISHGLSWRCKVVCYGVGGVRTVLTPASCIFLECRDSAALV